WLIARQVELLGKYSLALTCALLLIPAVLGGYARAFVWDCMTGQRLFARSDAKWEEAPEGSARNGRQKIRVVDVPPGEARLEIRGAWVGCAMPLFAHSTDRRVSSKRLGVIWRQPEYYPEGYAVRVSEAIHALTLHNSAAAGWWRANTPDLLIKP